MHYVIGTDEAGYGPNYGPLVVAASIWQLADDCPPTELARRLHPSVVNAAEDPGDGRAVVIDDSKRIYRPGKTLAGLESTVLASMSLSQPDFRNCLIRGELAWEDFARFLTPNSAELISQLPWYQESPPHVPHDTSRELLQATERILELAFAATQCRVSSLEAHAIPACQFNELLERWGPKSTVLSHTTLQLVRRRLDVLPQADVRVWCDRHGGRKHYAALLQHVFPESWVQVVQENKDCSVYRLQREQGSVEFRFQVKADQHLPCALASMVAKYIRELGMLAFNRYWARRVPGLRPTAGYPVDAKRFRRDIRPMQLKLQLADQQIWRAR